MTTKSADLPHLRSVVLAGHAGSGKTTLAEGLLFRTGATARLGRVDDGTSSLDFEPEEQKRHESLSLAVATLDDEGTRVTLDRHARLPRLRGRGHRGRRRGRRDRLRHGRQRRGRIRASRTAVALGRASGRAACFFINKCDRENADPTAALDALRKAFGNKIAPLHLAIGSAEKFTGYVDLVHRKAWHWDGSKEVEIPIPTELEAEVARRRDQLLEAAAEADDDVLAKYLDGEEVSDPELDACLRKGVKESILAPVLVGSAARGIGLRGLLDAFVRYLPSPADEGPVTAREPKIERPGRRAARPRRPAPGPGLQDRRRPVRRPPDLHPGAVRDAPFAGPRLERRPAARTSASASCSSSTARTRRRSASSRPARSARSRSCP